MAPIISDTLLSPSERDLPSTVSSIVLSNENDEDGDEEGIFYQKFLIRDNVEECIFPNLSTAFDFLDLALSLPSPSKSCEIQNNWEKSGGEKNYPDHLYEETEQNYPTCGISCEPETSKKAKVLGGCLVPSFFCYFSQWFIFPLDRSVGPLSRGFESKPIDCDCVLNGSKRKEFVRSCEYP